MQLLRGQGGSCQVGGVLHHKLKTNSGQGDLNLDSAAGPKAAANFILEQQVASWKQFRGSQGKVLPALQPLPPTRVCLSLS